MKLTILLFSFSKSTSYGSEDISRHAQLARGEAYLVNFLPSLAHTLLAAFDGDFIGLSGIILGHIDPNTVLVLEPLDVLPLCANNSGVILPGDSKDLNSLVRQLLNLGENPSLGLFGVPLATGDLDDALGRGCTLFLSDQLLGLL